MSPNNTRNSKGKNPPGTPTITNYFAGSGKQGVDSTRESTTQASEDHRWGKKKKTDERVPGRIITEHEQRRRERRAALKARMYATTTTSTATTTTSTTTTTTTPVVIDLMSDSDNEANTKAILIDAVAEIGQSGSEDSFYGPDNDRSGNYSDGEKSSSSSSFRGETTAQYLKRISNKQRSSRRRGPEREAKTYALSTRLPIEYDAYEIKDMERQLREIERRKFLETVEEDELVIPPAPTPTAAAREEHPEDEEELRDPGADFDAAPDGEEEHPESEGEADNPEPAAREEHPEGEDEVPESEGEEELAAAPEPPDAAEEEELPEPEAAAREELSEGEEELAADNPGLTVPQVTVNATGLVGFQVHTPPAVAQVPVPKCERRGGIYIHIFPGPEPILGIHEREWYGPVSVTPQDKIDALLEIHPPPRTNRVYVPQESYKGCLHEFVHEFMSAHTNNPNGFFTRGLRKYLREDSQKRSLAVFLVLLDVREAAKEAVAVGEGDQRPAYIRQPYNNLPYKKEVQAVYDAQCVYQNGTWLKSVFAETESEKIELEKQHNEEIRAFQASLKPRASKPHSKRARRG